MTNIVELSILDDLKKKDAEIEKLQREAVCLREQIQREQDTVLETIADYNEVVAVNEKLQRYAIERDHYRKEWNTSSNEALSLRAENEKLRAAMHDIYEVYAGSEGFIPQTCPEAYLQERVKEMADIAAKHKCAAALKETGDEKTSV